MTDPVYFNSGAGIKLAASVDGDGIYTPKVTGDALAVSVAVGQENKAGSLPVVLASDDDLFAKVGAVTETAPATDIASSGLNGRLQRLAQRITTLVGYAGDVVETAPATDVASSGLNGRLQRIAQRITTLLGYTGDVTENAPATDTDSSGLNGRLQRIAQRLTTLFGAMQGAGVDGSTTLTTGGAAQNLFSGVTPVNGFEICNPDGAEDLWISDSATAAPNGTGSYRVAANGSTYTTPDRYKPIGAVSVIAATTGHKITARKW